VSPELQRYKWHPHVNSEWIRADKNCFFMPAAEDDFGGKGFGTFKYKPSLDLTSTGLTKSCWRTLDFLSPKNDRVKPSTTASGKKFLHSGGRGQEFIFEVSDQGKLDTWLKRFLY